MTTEQLIHLAILFALFAVSAFFSSSETALLSFDRMRLSYLVQKKRRGAEHLEHLLNHPDHLLGTLLVGNNIVNIIASVFSTTLIVELFGPERGELYTILVLTPLLLIFAEVAPKTYAARRSEKVSFIVLPAVRLSMLLLTPIVWVISGISRLLISAFGAEERRQTISEDEIRTMINVGEQTGSVAQEKQKMLHGVFELSETQVRDVMIPRTEVVGIELQTPFAEILRIAQNSSHSRFPVYDGNLDSVVGIIHSKDILRFVDQPQAFFLRNTARPPYFVPESKRIGRLLQAFRKQQTHMAIVVDEYGGVEGIVTMEDIVEQIVGKIDDEYDVEEIPFREIGPARFLIDGGTPIRTVNRHFGLELSEEHVNTMAGFVLCQLGAIPEEGDTCTANGTTFVVRQVVDHRIEEIEMLLTASGKQD